jgi:hypothetical protein
MSLKIVGRGPRMSFAQSTATPQTAKGARLRCEACGKTISVMFPWGGTVLDRQQLIKDAADEHRRIGCTSGIVEDGRKFDIWYPRQN